MGTQLQHDKDVELQQRLEEIVAKMQNGENKEALAMLKRTTSRCLPLTNAFESILKGRASEELRMTQTALTYFDGIIDGYKRRRNSVHDLEKELVAEAYLSRIFLTGLENDVLNFLSTAQYSRELVTQYRKLKPHDAIGLYLATLIEIKTRHFDAAQKIVQEYELSHPENVSQVVRTLKPLTNPAYTDIPSGREQLKGLATRLPKDYEQRKTAFLRGETIRNIIECVISERPY